MSVAIVPAFLSEKENADATSNDDASNIKSPFPLEVIALCMLRFAVTCSPHWPLYSTVVSDKSQLLVYFL